MYHESGLCGFLKGAERISNRKASLCEDLKFAMWQDNKKPTAEQVGKVKLIMARIFEWKGFFPDISEYKGYRNS